MSPKAILLWKKYCVHPTTRDSGIPQIIQATGSSRIIIFEREFWYNFAYHALPLCRIFLIFLPHAQGTEGETVRMETSVSVSARHRGVLEDEASRTSYKLDFPYDFEGHMHLPSLPP